MPTGHDPTALIDTGVLDEMRDAMRPGEFARILEVFLADTRSRVARVCALHQEGDLARLADECHDLSSTLGTFGAGLPMALTREAMQAARQADLPRLARSVGELDGTCARMAAMLCDQYLSGGSRAG